MFRPNDQKYMKEELPKIYNHKIAEGFYYDMVLVKAGHFIMGSESEDADSDERPEHIVEITQDFYMGKYPVTQGIWKAIMEGYNPSSFKGDNRPVERISWQDIMEGGQDEEVPESFLYHLNKKTEKGEGLNHLSFRLPTEAEWEYAAKGGHLSKEFDLENPPKASELYHKYVGSDKLKNVGWYSQNSHRESKEVGMLQPNELGLYDMSGNVREWCLDYYGSSFYQQCHDQGIVKDPLCTEGPSRVYRGGSWISGAQFCRSSFRNRWPPTHRLSNVGFRLVLASSSAEWRKQV